MPRNDNKLKLSTTKKYFWYYFTLLVALTVHISRWQTEEETEFVNTKGNYNINVQCITDHYKTFILNQSGAFWITFFCLVIDGDNDGLSFLKSSKSWVFMNSINTDTSGTLKLDFPFFFFRTQDLCNESIINLEYTLHSTFLNIAM